LAFMSVDQANGNMAQQINGIWANALADNARKARAYSFKRLNAPEEGEQRHGPFEFSIAAFAHISLIRYIFVLGYDIPIAS